MRTVRMRLFLSIPISVALIKKVSCFYLPGVAPTNYDVGEPVPVYVNAITPSLSQSNKQLKSLISYDCTFSP